MRLRAIILLVFAVALLIQQLPLEPTLWGETPACCALAKYCPMTAKPERAVRSGSSCEMKSAPACSIRASCPSGRHTSDGAISAQGLARPAVLDELAWTPVLAPSFPMPSLESAIVSPPGESPPTPPPRPAFA